MDFEKENNLNGEAQLNNDENNNYSIDLEVEPSGKLIFNQLASLNQTSFIITNKTDKKISFEINTTNPKRCQIKPSSGILDSKRKIKIDGLMHFLMFKLKYINLISLFI
jgi:hypothetical protein